MTNAQMNGEQSPEGQQGGSTRPQSRPQGQQQGQSRQPAEGDRPQMGTSTGLGDWASI